MMAATPARLTHLTVLATLILALSTPGFGQSLYGSLVGTVTDPSGLAVPGATVKLTQAETNQSREATTMETGGYNFANLPPGTYQVDVTLQGFQTFSARRVSVQQGTAVRVDARLTVGALQEAVVVSGTAVVLQTESAAVQAKMTSEQLETLPTSGRAFQSFMTLMPGVAQPNYIQAGGINNPARSMAVSVNGQPPTNTVFRFDGVTATNQWFQELQAYSPGQEAIETVSVVTNSFDADQGMAGGASVNVQIKTGSNDLHGSAFEYGTGSGLRARNYFLPAGGTKGTERKNVFGGTAGGPVVHNKFFFFFSTESTQDQITNGVFPAQIAALTPGIRSVAPADLRSGNFANTGTVIYDPNTGAATGTGRIPFGFENCPALSSTSDPGFAACNYIPANRLNPIAQNLLAKLPLPSAPGYFNNYYANGTYGSWVHKIDSKFTWTPDNKLNVNARMSYLPNNENNSGIFPDPGGAQYNPLSIGRQFTSSVRSGSWSATYILSPTFVLDGVFGFTRAHQSVAPEGPANTCWGEAFGIPNACPRPPGLIDLDRATPSFSMGNWATLGNSPMRDYLDHSVSAVANAGWTRGTHSIKFGVDINRQHLNHYETSSPPTFAFNGGATALNGGASPNDFNSFADFLLGLPTSRSVQADSPLLSDEGADPERPATLRYWQFGSYLRDQWQVNRKMTASLGLRWEYYPYPRRADRGLEVFDFVTNTVQECGVAGSNAAVCGIQVEKKLFTPRLGLAYRPTESTVIRAGFSRNPQNNSPVVGSTSTMYSFPATILLTEAGTNTFTPVGSLNSGVSTIPAANIAGGSVSLPPGTGVVTDRGRYVRGHITSYNVTVQRLFRYSLNAQVGYVANRQDDMTVQQNLNYGQIGGGAASQPFNQPGLAGGLRTTSTMSVFQPLGRVKYDALQTSVSRRMSGGFQLTFAYTYAKATDWWAGTIPIPEYWDLNKGPQGGTYAAVPHKMDMSAVYELPFGEGRKFLSTNSVLGKVVGGWQLNAFFTASSGKPFSVTSNAASLNAPGSPQYADQIRPDVAILGFAPGQAYFDVTAFAPVTTARFGTAKVNSLRGPGVANLDMSLFRTIGLGRGMKLQFRIEAFNITNTPHFALPANLNVSNLQLNPDGSVKSLNGFGVINATQSIGRDYDERYFRLGMRMSF
jgi:Carboxypeptidase regulatory-like domain/TonB dependent receptor